MVFEAKLFWMNKKEKWLSCSLDKHEISERLLIPKILHHSLTV
jgi:hypothetical protein